MKKYPDPWANLPHPFWQFSALNSATDLQELMQQNTPLMVFPTYTNPCAYSISGNVAMPFSEIQEVKSSQIMPTLNSPANPTFIAPKFTGYQNRILAFNQSCDRTSIVFSSLCNPSLTVNPTNQSLEHQGSNDTASIGHGGEEMHEDTEEINALLYSDTDDDHGEGEASTGNSPIEPMAGISSEAVSSVVPLKRKRVDADEPDLSPLNTVSSEDSHYNYSNSDIKDIKSGSSFIKGDDQDCKRLKRDRILQTVDVLRRIIPGGKGKDAVTVLDEAIRYLKSLRPDAKALGL